MKLFSIRMLALITSAALLIIGFPIALKLLLVLGPIPFLALVIGTLLYFASR